MGGGLEDAGPAGRRRARRRRECARAVRLWHLGLWWSLGCPLRDERYVIEVIYQVLVVSGLPLS